jgi:predicted nucleic acid-binding protein
MAGLTVVDASVLIAWLDETDSHHHDAIELLAGTDGFIVHPITLAEVLVHPTRVGRAGQVLARLETIGMIVSALPIEPVALADLRVRTGLKMPDVLVLACAQAHDATIATFDRRLGQPAG